MISWLAAAAFGFIRAVMLAEGADWR